MSHTAEHPHTARRQLASASRSSLIVVAGPEPGVRSGTDSALPGPEFHRLTGLAVPGARLIIQQNAHDILFIPAAAATAPWGELADEVDIQVVSGISLVLPLSEFPAVLRASAYSLDRVAVLAEENPFTRGGGDTGFVEALRRELPLHVLERIAPCMAALRAVKSPGELASMRKAAAMAVAGLKRAVGSIRPGVRGFEVKAEYLYEISRRGSAGWGCPPITASGAETLLLHWHGDKKPWESGDLALLDFTAESSRSHVDLARCVPVNGRFTPRQRQMYDEVVGLLHDCTALLQPGPTLLECQTEAQRLSAAAAHRLGLTSLAAGSPYQHRIFHHIGLEVHDPVPDSLPLKEGAVLAVEPGLYSPAIGLGIRLENTVALTSSGQEILTAAMPVSASEIEALMQA